MNNILYYFNIFVKYIILYIHNGDNHYTALRIRNNMHINNIR